MVRSVLCLLTVALAFVPLLSTVEGMPPLTKPGTCPSPKPFKFCYGHCHYDRDCEGDLKCCPNSCGHTCEPPVTVPKEKPGTCPATPPFGGCHRECTCDDDCRDDLKCCSNGCGHTCQKPVTEAKPGCCPAPIPHFIRCRDECSSDSQCPKNLKCCYSGCGWQCLCPQQI